MKISVQNNNLKSLGREVVIKGFKDIPLEFSTISKLTIDLKNINFIDQTEVLAEIATEFAKKYSTFSLDTLSFHNITVGENTGEKYIARIVHHASISNTFELNHCAGTIKEGLMNLLLHSGRIPFIKNFIFTENKLDIIAVCHLGEFLYNTKIPYSKLSIEFDSKPLFSLNRLLERVRLPADKTIELAVKGYNTELFYKLAKFIEKTFEVDDVKIAFKDYQALRGYQKNKNFIKPILSKEGESFLTKVDDTIAGNFFKFTGITKNPLLPELCKVIANNLGDCNLSEINFVTKNVIKTDLVGDSYLEHLD